MPQALSGRHNGDVLALSEPIVHQRLTQQLLHCAPTTLYSGMAAGAVVAAALYRLTGEPAIAIWLGLLLTVSIGRLALVRILKRHAGTDRALLASRAYAASALVGGLVWAGLILLDGPHHPLAAHLLVAITLVGMPVASLSSNAIVPLVFRTFAVPVFAAMALWAWWINPTLSIEFSLLVIAYMALVFSMAGRYHHSLRSSLVRDIENERLLHEVNEMNAELQRLAYLDPLTGLSNRRSFEESAGRLLNRLRPGEMVVLMLIDMDDFKRINDSLGHAAGDQALVTLSRRIEENSRLSEMLAHTPASAARIGGDEFIVIYRLEPTTAIEPLAQRILHALMEPMTFEGQTYQPSVSIGIALAPLHATELDHLLRQADTAMYRAKSAGGGNFEIATGSTVDRASGG